MGKQFKFWNEFLFRKEVVLEEQLFILRFFLKVLNRVKLVKFGKKTEHFYETKIFCREPKKILLFETKIPKKAYKFLEKNFVLQNLSKLLLAGYLIVLTSQIPLVQDNDKSARGKLRDFWKSWKMGQTHEGVEGCPIQKILCENEKIRPQIITLSGAENVKNIKILKIRLRILDTDWDSKPYLVFKNPVTSSARLWSNLTKCNKNVWKKQNRE